MLDFENRAFYRRFDNGSKTPLKHIYNSFSHSRTHLLKHQCMSLRKPKEALPELKEVRGKGGHSEPEKRLQDFTGLILMRSADEGRVSLKLS